MLHCGLRFSKVVNLKPGNLNLTKEKLRVESDKGKKDRDLAIPDYITDLLDTWKKIRPKSNFFSQLLKAGNFQIDTFNRWLKNTLIKLE